MKKELQKRDITLWDYLVKKLEVSKNKANQKKARDIWNYIQRYYR